MKRVLLLLLLALAAWHFGGGNVRTLVNAAPAAAVQDSPAAVQGLPAAESAFRCDGRIYCGQMRSCAEAKWFLRHCPRVKLDGDNNGIPCERQWCN